MYLLTLWLAWCLVAVSVARMNYLKDLSMDVQFPGPVYKHTKQLPEGHMRPLGWQRRPDGPVPEEQGMPGTREFYEKFVRDDIPVVFRGAITEAPAFTAWSNDRYLTDTYGDLYFTTRVKTGRSQGRMVSTEETIKLKTFLNDYMYDNIYLASILPREMMHELPLPKCVRCGTINENLISAQLWMSSGGTSSRVHSHDDHLLHCVLFGRRDFILIEDMHKNSFPYHDEYPGSLGGYSDVNTETVNVFDFKNSLRIPWIWASLFPGECLFVPAGYLHQVRSYGRSLSLTIEFSRIGDFDDSGCHLIEKEFVPLSDAYFLLAFEDGRLRLHEVELTTEKLRHVLISLVGKHSELRVEKFVHFYKQVIGEDTNIPPARSVFDILTSGKYDNKLTKIDILNLPDSTLQKVVDIVNDVYADIRRKARRPKLEAAKVATNETDKSIHLEF